MGMHLLAELATAVFLVIGGLRSRRVSGIDRLLLIFGIGMLCYTMVATIGWSIQEEIYPVALGMVFLIICTVALLIPLLRIEENE